MSVSEKDSVILEKILNNTNDDFLDFVTNFMHFFTPNELRSTIQSFNDNLDIISEEISAMIKILNDKYDNLKHHGLIERELTRKYEIYKIVRDDFHTKKLIFVTSFVKLGKILYNSNIELARNKNGIISKVKDLPSSIKSLYETTRDKLKELKISKERFYEFLNSILESIAGAIGIGGVVSEYKDSVEIVTKKENSIQFNVIVFQLGPELFKKMELYLKNNSIPYT